MPPELLGFLLSGGGRSLSIRGQPGTGKTSLALELLVRLPGHKFFLSTRVDLARLVRQFPFLETKKEDLDVMDLTALRGERLLMKSDVLFLKTNLLKAGSTPLGMDLDRFMTLPAPLQEVYSRAPEGPGNATIVIDSWEALVTDYASRVQGSFKEPLTEEELAESLLSLYSSQGTNLILVRETADWNAVDYLVDGVVEARRELFQEHVLRTASLLKLRGTPVGSAEYPFTLHGGRFQYLLSAGRNEKIRVAPELLGYPRPGYPHPASASRFSWGHPQMADAIGPLLPSSVIFLESAGRTQDDVLGRLVVHAAYASGALGSGPHIFLPEEISPLAATRSWPSPSGVHPRGLRLIWSAQYVSKSMVESTGFPSEMLFPTEVDEDRAMKSTAISSLLMGPDPRGVLAFATLTTLRHLSGRDPKAVDKTLRALYHLNGERQGVLMIGGVEGEPGSEFMARNCSLHLRLHEKYGLKLLERMHDPGPLLVILTPKDPARSPAFELLPLV